MKHKISLWVPASYKLEALLSWLSKEIDQANNIKNRVHRELILSGLHLLQNKVREGIPSKGILLFTDGNGVFEQDHITSVCEFKYSCSADFLDFRDQETPPIAVISVDNDDAAIGIRRNGSIECLWEGSSGVGGKHGKGGQSQRRYERNREADLHTYYKRVASKTMGLMGCRELVLSGPGFAKNKVFDLLDYRLKQLPTSFVNQEYSGFTGLMQTNKRLG